VEIRQIFEMEDLARVMTPEIGEQAAELRAHITAESTK